MMPEDRYLTDAQFHMLVDWLENFIRQAQYTPSELRDAAMLAAIHYEMHNVRAQYFIPMSQQEPGPFPPYPDLQGMTYYPEPQQPPAPPQKPAKPPFWVRRQQQPYTGETRRLDEE